MKLDSSWDGEYVCYIEQLSNKLNMKVKSIFVILERTAFVWQLQLKGNDISLFRTDKKINFILF